MKNSYKTDTNPGRRKFLVNTGRFLILGVLAVISSLSLKKTDDASGDICPSTTLCKECKSSDKCNLPGARKQRSKEGLVRKSAGLLINR
jgi:hypothetical protein